MPEAMVQREASELSDESTKLITRSAQHAEALSALLVTDLESFTSLLVRVGDLEARNLLREYNALLRTSLAVHGGVEITHVGDGVLASFRSIHAALNCAAEIQESLAQRADERTSSPFRTRIGVHAGEPFTEEGRLFGICVNTAFRICDAAASGSILVSDVARQLAEGKRLLFTDRGDFALQGLPRPLRLHELVWNRAPSC